MAGSRYSLITVLSSLTICLSATLCTPDDIARENMKKLAKASNQVAINILHHISSKSSENVFFSPLSLSTAFGMLYYGAKGHTAEELRNALGYETADLPQELVHETFHRYLNLLPSQDSTAYVLSAANSILLDKDLKVDSSYVKQVQDLYHASVKDVDFSSEKQKVIQDVNSWVKENTNGKIDKLLEDLDPSASLIILNAIYFKGTWKKQFEPSRTRPLTFYNNGLESHAKKVPMMRMTEEFSYTSTNAAQFLEMPYKGDNISMVVILPNERKGLESLENNLSIETLSTIWKDVRKRKVHVTLPKFKLEYSREMSEDFQSLGAKNIFKPGADFSGITTSDKIYVSQVVHKAVIEVNEEGSEAAGVTGIISNRMRPIFDPTPDFVADHPFLFAIMDRRNDMVLFAGRVTNL